MSVLPDCSHSGQAEKIVRFPSPVEQLEPLYSERSHTFLLRLSMDVKFLEADTFRFTYLDCCSYVSSDFSDFKINLFIYCANKGQHARTAPAKL